MGRVTAASRADEESMGALANIEQEMLAMRQDGRSVAALVRRMESRQERLAVYISRATGTTLLTVRKRRDEPLPHVPAGMLR